MIQSLTCKEKIRALLADLRDFLFPPVCAACDALSSTQIFCLHCWESCALLSFEERCPHCFTESFGLCRQCRRAPFLPFPSAAVFDQELAPLYLMQRFPEMIPFFLLYQWGTLPWRLPDVILSMPGAENLAIAFAHLIHRPYVNILEEGEVWICDANAIEENQTLLLIDVDSSLERKKKGVLALSNVFPKKGYLLSVFPPFGINGA